MASPSPTPPSLSPTPHPAHLHHPPQPQSKRDKRRNALSDKLNQLTKSFHHPTNPRVRDQHYRSQITSIQVDMQLIQKANISGRDMRLMDDSCEAIQKQVESVLSTTNLRSTDISAEGLSGRWYSDFLRDVNDNMEERDTQLTLLFNLHRTKAASIAAQHTRALIHAREEHRSLAGTIQSRLSQRLKAQLKKVAHEKELSSSSANALSSLSISGGLTDISESNALHLHPSHFGLAAGIGSPRRHGGIPFDDDTEKETSTRRKPRRRAGEVEELIAFGAGMNFDSPNSNGKRKRRGAVPESVPEDVPTPPPFAGVFEAASPTANPPHESSSAESGEDTRRKREEMLKQVYKPVYTMEKLFTDKELQLHSNQATLATLRYFSERAGRDADHDHAGGDDTDDTPTGANTPVPGGASVAAGDDEEDTEERGRGLSPLSELTRGLPALPGFGGVNTRSNPPRNFASSREMESLVLGGVPGVGMSYVNKTGIAPPPPGLRNDDAEADLAFLRRGEKRNSAGVEGGPKRQKRG